MRDVYLNGALGELLGNCREHQHLIFRFGLAVQNVVALRLRVFAVWFYVGINNRVSIQ